MAVTLVRPSVSDDSGGGTDGTILDAAFFTDFQNKIDTALALLLPLAGGTVSGAVTFSAVNTYNGFGTHAFSAGGTGANALRVRNTTAGTTNYSEVALGNDTSAARGYLEMFSTTYTPASTAFADSLLIQSDGAGGMVLAAGHASGVLRLYAGGTTEVARFGTTGSLQIGGTAARSGTAGTKRLDIFDGTAPVGTLANGCSIYSTAGELRTMDSAGNATLQTPHDHGPDWVFLSENAVTGKRVRIEVEKLLQRLNAQFGEADWFIREAR